MDAVLTVIRKHWGYTSLRPLQREAMAAAVEGRDSLVVLPTGGGKSICYQAPAILSDRPTVVVSPLIALMKDQVDQLIGRGVPSAFFNSSLDAGDRRRVTAGILDRTYKLVFLAPERFADPVFLDLLAEAGVGSFAIDEAHCISHWGHDFRQDYRRLGQLKDRFPDASVHAFTATATHRVREDILAQLRLSDPAVLLGDFYRPNLHYRVCRRGNVFADVLGVIETHPRQAGIVYCIRRDDVDDLAARLEAAGVRAVGYHAGMSDDMRTQAQDAFAAGKVDIVVATVAFGMGIDRADIRFVVHAAMPKSIEHYQQETGRAGRDGQPADCVLFYSPGDFRLWQTIVGNNGPADCENQFSLLSEMYRFCTGMSCRHRRLVSYFGQAWDRRSCEACDVCTGQCKVMRDATVLAQKIMSCVVRTGERYGPAYIADVLMGKASERVRERGHDRLSTFGLMPDHPKTAISAWIDQLADQEMLERYGEYGVLRMTSAGWRVLRSQAEARLIDVGHRGAAKTKLRPPRKSRGPESARRPSPPTQTADGAVAGERLDGDTLVLFERLRRLRRAIADERKVPAFIVFSDKTLREIARQRPASRTAFLAVKGVGPAKWSEFGPRFLEAVLGNGR